MYTQLFLGNSETGEMIFALFGILLATIGILALIAIIKWLINKLKE